MKLLFSLSALLLSLNVFAQRVDMEINGRPYSCVPRSGGTPGGGDAGSCATVAYSGPFSREESIRLCAGSRSEAPARCAIAAYSGPFSKEESINLCAGAYSTGPSECAVKAYTGIFSKSESLDLCSSPYASVATATCAINAYSGAYNRQEAINLCRNSKSLGLTAELLTKEESEQLMIEANEKAMREGVYKR
ncbi:MAG: hypothetical protein K2P81_01935 [Bacteriovoracaceae bacterium]|nr:hypothetical protein [Bacteriovoracaceae bacterium]